MSSKQLSHVQQVLAGVAIAGSALIAGACSPSSNQGAATPSGSPEVVVVEEQPTRAPSPNTRLYQNGADSGTDDAAEVAREEATVEIAGVTKSISDPDSIWVLVNKQNPLPRSYEPTDLVVPDMHHKGEHNQLRAEAAQALVAMSEAADEEVGKPIQLVSGYRSYDDQKEIYERYVAKDGQEHADTYSARPGYSEHQTGLAADLSTVHGKMEKFGNNKLGEWTKENAWRFGFILRYTPENLDIVGYQSEPWHYRYVGPELAKYYHDAGINSLEEAFDQPAAPNYR